MRQKVAACCMLMDMETNIPSVIQPLLEHFTHFRVSLALIYG